MQTSLKKISIAAMMTAALSLPVAGQAQSMGGMVGMSGMGGMQGMSGMSGMAGMYGMGGMAGMQVRAELAQRVKMSRMAIKGFVTSLQGELKTAMKAGGPVNAIGVCNEKAPRIEQDQNSKLGFEISRVSLKNRNPDNVPDEWETSVLEIFENMKKLGKAPGALEYYDVVDTGVGREFRYMKAIPTGEVCTKCHGTEIDPKVAAKLQELYPEDKATGFELGDLRGAFVVRQSLN